MIRRLLSDQWWRGSSMAAVRASKVRSAAKSVSLDASTTRQAFMGSVISRLNGPTLRSEGSGLARAEGVEGVLHPLWTMLMPQSWMSRWG